MGCFDDGYLYVVVDFEEWYFVFLGELGSGNFVFNVMFVEVIRDENVMYVFEWFYWVVIFELFVVELFEIDFYFIGDVVMV